MTTFEVKGPDGRVYEVQADTIEQATAAVSSVAKPAPQEPNINPGVDPSAPPEMFLNPNTGQYTSRELLRNIESQSMTRPEAALVGGTQGLTFGGADEALGAANAVIPGEADMASRYTFGREAARAQEEAAREKFPYTTGGAEVAGAAIPAILSYGSTAPAQASLKGEMALGAKIGTAEGLTYGALSGEGGAYQRIMNALQYGVLGGTTGGLIPIATTLGKKAGTVVADAVGGGVDALRGRPSQTRANRALNATLGRSGRSVDDIADDVARAGADGQPEFTIADALGVSGQRRLSGIARGGGDASAEIADFLNNRQLNQPERVAGFVDDAFDLSGSSANAARTALTQGRDEAADIAFGGIRAAGEPVDIRSVVSVLDDKIGPYENAGIADDGVNYLKALRGQLAAQGDDASFELSDFSKVFAIRKRLRDKITSLYRSGENELAGELKEVRRAMDAALSASSDEYKAAMEAFAQQSRVIDAVDTGANMARPGSRAVDNADAFSRLSPDEQAAARVGYGDRAAARIEASAGEGTNRARAFTSIKAGQEADAIATDPRLFRDRIARENTMFETRNRALGGSRTADNLEDVADLQPYDANLIVNLLTGNLRAAGQQAAQGLSNTATGMNQETRQIIARALLNRDPAALRQALSQAATSQERQAIVDALLRAGTQRQGIPALTE